MKLLKAFAFLLVLTCSGAWAQGYPAKPVRIIVPFAPARDRHRHPASGAEADRNLGPVGDRREPQRRRRQHRRRSGGQVHARRLYAVHDFGLHRHRQSVYLQENGLRSAKDLIPITNVASGRR